MRSTREMSEHLKIKITRKVGTADAPALIAKLNDLGVEDNVEFYEEGISIPAELVNDIESFQKELRRLSKVQRLYPIKLADNRIQINHLSLTSIGHAQIGRAKRFGGQRIFKNQGSLVEITSERFQFPRNPRNPVLTERTRRLNFSYRDYNRLNGAQRNIIEAVFAFALEAISELSPLNAIKALNAIMSAQIDVQLSREDRQHFKDLDVLEWIEEGRKILSHPCPQNRADSYPYVGQEEGFSMFKLDKARIKTVSRNGDIDLKNGRFIPKTHIIRFSSQDSYFIAKEQTGLLGLTGREDDKTIFVTKNAVLNYANKLIQDAILKNEERAAKKIQLFYRDRKFLMFVLPGFRDKFKRVMLALNNWLLRERFIHTDMVTQIDELNNIPKFALYNCISHFNVSEDNTKAFHYLYLHFIRLGNEVAVNAFMANKNLNPYFSYVYHEKNSDTALSTASYFQHGNLLRRFLRLGMDCNTIIVFDYTPFTWAVRKGHLEMVQIFLEEKTWKDLLPDYDAEIVLREAIRYLVTLSPPNEEQKNNKIIELINSAYIQSQSPRLNGVN